MGEGEKEEPAPVKKLGLVGLAVELLLPCAVAGAALVVLARRIPAWDLRTRAGLITFGVLLVVASVALSIRLDAFTLSRRRAWGRRQLFNRADSRSRLVKWVLAGIVIPLAAFFAATRLELPDHRTPMTVALEMRLPAQVGRAEQVLNAARRAGSPAVWVPAIHALQGLASDDALQQLLRILDEEPSVLKDGGASRALSTALASYGAPAGAALRQRLEALPAAARKAGAPAPEDPYGPCLSAGLAGLESRIARTVDPQAREARLNRLHVARAELEEVVREDAGGAAGRGLAPFVMETLLQLGVTEDGDLLGFARQTAADTSWSDDVRAQALMVMAKLGGKPEVDELFVYLDNPSATLRAGALEAIAALQTRLAAVKGSGS